MKITLIVGIPPNWSYFKAIGCTGNPGLNAPDLN